MEKAVEDERSLRSDSARGSVTASVPQCHSLVRMVCRQLLTQLGRALGVNGPEVQSSPLYPCIRPFNFLLLVVLSRSRQMQLLLDLLLLLLLRVSVWRRLASVLPD